MPLLSSKDSWNATRRRTTPSFFGPGVGRRRRYDDARRHFDTLLKAYPDKPEIIYSVAILALQQNDKTRAEEQLKHFVTLNVQDKSPAYYHLGQIAEDDQRRDEALTYYGEVVAGEHYLPAQSAGRGSWPI